MSDRRVSQDPADPVRRRQERDMAAQSAWRVLAVIGLWAATLWLRDGASPWRLAVLNAGLAAASWWALRPGWRGGGSRFGWANNWTGALVFPFVWFTVSTLYSIWGALRGF